MKKPKNLGLIALALLVTSCLGATMSKKTQQQFEKYRNHYSCILQHCFEQACVQRNKKMCSENPAYPKKESAIVCYDLQCNPTTGSLESYRFDGCVEWCASSPDSPDAPGSLYIAPQP